MRKTIYIYDNERNSTGVWVSEKLKKSYSGGDCEEVTIEIPDTMEAYTTETGDTMVKIGDYFYSLDECLRIDKNDLPYIKKMGPSDHITRLKIVARNGRRSLAFTMNNA